MHLPRRLGGFVLRSVAGMADATYMGRRSAAMPGMLQNFTAVHPVKKHMMVEMALCNSCQWYRH
jgi:hypothetical protein